MLNSVSVNKSSRLQVTNAKLAQENQNLQQEVARLREMNHAMEDRWESTERGLKSAKQEMKSIISQKDVNYNKLEDEYVRVQEQLGSLLKQQTSEHSYTSARSLHSSGLNMSNRRTKIENLFNDDNLLSGTEDEYPIWAANIKRADERTIKARDELRISESVNHKLEEKVLRLESDLIDKIKPLNRKIDELEEDKAKLRLENTKLEVSLRQKEKEKDLFVDKLIASQAKLESSEEEVRVLKSSLQRSETVLKFNESSLNRLKSRVDDLEDENLSLIELKNELQAQVDRAQREVRTIREELEYGLRNSVRDKKDAALQSQEETRLKEEVASLRGKVEELEAQLKENEAKNSEFDSEKVEVQKIVETKEKQLEELERTNEELEEELSNVKLKLEESLNFTTNYEKRIRDLEEKLTKSYIDLKYSNSDNEELRSNQKDFEAVKRQLEEALLQNEALENRALIAEDENMRLRENTGEDIVEEETMRTNLKVVEFERMELLHDYKRVCMENEKVKGELEEILSAHKESLRELRDTKTEAVALQTQLTEKENENEKEEEEYVAQLALYADLNNKLTLAENEAVESKKAQEKLNEELLIVREEKEKLERSQTETQQSQQAIEAAQKENERLKLELELSKKDMKTLREELDKKAINNEVLKGLLEDQKKNEWKSSLNQSGGRLNPEESFLSNKSKNETKRRGINSERTVNFYSPSGRSDNQWDQGYKNFLTEPSDVKSYGYEDRRAGYGSQGWSIDLGRSLKPETKTKWESSYEDDSRKKKYGSVSIAYDKRYSKF